jgi:CDP-glucose 4,6-dehydratase
MRTVDSSFWKGKKVFITGHTGFKGSWLSIWLMEMGAELKGYSLKPQSKPNLFEATNLTSKMKSEIGDIRDYNNLKASMQSFSPEIIFHLAAQPLVRDSYEDPLYTYETNVMGTANLLQASREVSSIKSIIIVTTDKCYENNEWEWGYRENDPLGGHDPYSSSKGGTELVTSAFRRSYFYSKNVGVASVRAGNVIGGGDWSKDRLIPDIFRSYNEGKKVIIRNPSSIRPWQHVIEPLSGYLVLAEELYKSNQKFSKAFNFGPNDKDCQTVEKVLSLIDTYWIDCPGWKLDSNTNPHEAKFLKLDISRAKAELNWTPRWNLQAAIKRTVEWNLAFKNKENMYLHCVREINDYIKS